MNAKIIAFPGCASVAQPTTTPSNDDAFTEWYEDSLVPLVGDVEEMDRLALEPDRTMFWHYARQIREALKSWPIPEETP